MAKKRLKKAAILAESCGRSGILLEYIPRTALNPFIVVPPPLNPPGHWQGFVEPCVLGHEQVLMK